MMNKIKLKDKLKSWLYTLGVASFACALGVCVSVSEKYQKASAYYYQDNGALEFVFQDGITNLDTYYVGDFFLSKFDGTETYLFYNIDIVEEGYSIDYIYNDYDNGVLEFGNNDDRIALISISYDSDYSVSTYEDNTYTMYFPFGSVLYQPLRNFVISYNAPQNSGNFVTSLTDFMSLIGGGIIQLAQSVGAGVVSFATGLFLDSGHLSILGGIIGIFAGIALAVGITSKVYTWVSTLGN